MTHGVSSVEWKHYRYQLPDSVHDVYIKCWKDVRLRIRARLIRVRLGR